MKSLAQLFSAVKDADIYILKTQNSGTVGSSTKSGRLLLQLPHNRRLMEDPDSVVGGSASLRRGGYTSEPNSQVGDVLDGQHSNDQSVLEEPTVLPDPNPAQPAGTEDVIEHKPGKKIPHHQRQQW
jgi:hypothetical protein